MSEQTEAHRLAIALEFPEAEELEQAAAELRRLSAANAKFLEFAREYLKQWGDLEGYLQDMAREAIAKHGTKQ